MGEEISLQGKLISILVKSFIGSNDNVNNLANLEIFLKNYLKFNINVDIQQTTMGVYVKVYYQKDNSNIKSSLDVTILTKLELGSMSENKEVIEFFGGEENL